MTSITVNIDDGVAETLRRIAEARKCSEEDVVREALTLFSNTRPPLPIGMGKYRSGQTETSKNSRSILREAAKEGVWP